MQIACHDCAKLGVDLVMSNISAVFQTAHLIKVQTKLYTSGTLKVTAVKVKCIVCGSTAAEGPADLVPFVPVLNAQPFIMSLISPKHIPLGLCLLCLLI